MLVVDKVGLVHSGSVRFSAPLLGFPWWLPGQFWAWGGNAHRAFRRCCWPALRGLPGASIAGRGFGRRVKRFWPRRHLHFGPQLHFLSSLVDSIPFCDFRYCLLGPRIVPFFPFWLGGSPYSNLSTGGPSLHAYLYRYSPLTQATNHRDPSPSLKTMTRNGRKTMESQGSKWNRMSFTFGCQAL